MISTTRFATLLALVTISASSINAFSFSTAKASSPVMDEAIAIYDQKFPFGREPPKKDFRGDFGMPNQDIDGTRIKKDYGTPSRMTDITEAEARAAFTELSKLYTEDRAIEMVKAMPICLAFDKNRWAECLDIFAEEFGLEAAQDMVKRNPGLLAVKPKDAASTDASAMAFSYIIAITRPAGPFLLGGLLLALLTPFFKTVTGIDF